MAENSKNNAHENDGLQVRLLDKTEFGQPGDVITLSRSVALDQVGKGLAAIVANE